MTLHTVRRGVAGTSDPPAPDPALDEALEHIVGLAERLWAVRRLHAPRPARVLLGRAGRRCAGCGHAVPCPTLRAASAA